MALDSDFFAARRFNRLHTRLILTLQDQLVELESRLDEVDKNYSSMEHRDINNGTIRDDTPQRASIVTQISLKLAEYGTSGPARRRQLRD